MKNLLRMMKNLLRMVGVFANPTYAAAGHPARFSLTQAAGKGIARLQETQQCPRNA